jgi:peptidoglycan/LPS O-acetylase OafA/YrhL
MWRRVPFQIAANLVFQAQDWGCEIRPLSNGPFWSMSFECFYYAVYGLVFYRVRATKLWCFLLLLVAGPSISLLLLVWLLGCYAFDGYVKPRKSPAGLYVSSVIVAGMSLVLFFARGRIRELLVYVDEPHRTEWLSHLLMPVPHHEVLLLDGRVPWLTYATPSFFVVGLATSAFSVWSLLLIDRLRMGVGALVTRWVRLVADSTFALYLLHLPMLILVGSIVGKPIHARWFSAIILCLIVCSCVLVSIPLDGLKRNLRARMERSR